jgi:hypothetical protein
MKAIIDMKGVYGTYYTRIKEFKNESHLDNWCAWMHKNQNRVKIIGTTIL